MSQNPQATRVTVVVPTYRRPGLLSRCLESLRVQTYPHFTVFVCDNSPDREAARVVAQLNDARFEYHPRPTNLGIFANAMTGFRAANTDYVMEVDDDDQLYPRGIEMLLEPFIKNPDVVLTFGELDVVDVHGRVLVGPERRLFIPDRRDLREGVYAPFTALAARGHIFVMASMIRKDAVDFERIPVEVGTAYDRFIGLAAARAGHPAYFVDKPVAIYQIHAEADGYLQSQGQFLGALAGLSIERDYTSPHSRGVIDAEIVRLHLMRCRSFASARSWRMFLFAVKPVFSPRLFLPLIRLLLTDAIPRRLRGWSSPGASWNRRRDQIVGR